MITLPSETDDRLLTVLVDGAQWFRASDIAAIVGLKNIRSATASFHKSQKTVLSMFTDVSTTQRRRMLFLSVEGVIRFLCSSHKPVPQWLLDKFVITQHRFTLQETDFVDNIRTAFPETEWIAQHYVDPYYIDLYSPTYNLALEFDEVVHRYHSEQDGIRQASIEERLRCTFIRVAEKDNIFAKIAEIRAIIDLK